MKTRFSFLATTAAALAPLSTWACMNDSYVGPFEEGMLSKYLPQWFLLILPIFFILGFALFVISRYLEAKSSLSFSQKLGTWEFLGAFVFLFLLASIPVMWGFFAIIWGFVCFADAILNFSLGRFKENSNHMMPAILWASAILFFFFPLPGGVHFWHPVA